MSNDNHIYTEDFRRLSRELSKKGVSHPGAEAMKLLGVEKSVKKKYHDDYLDEKARKR